MSHKCDESYHLLHHMRCNYVNDITLLAYHWFEQKNDVLWTSKKIARQKIKNFKFLNHYGKRGLRSWFWFEIWHEIGRPQFQLNFIIKKRFWHLVFLPPSPNKRLKTQDKERPELNIYWYFFDRTVLLERMILFNDILLQNFGYMVKKV